MSRRLSSTPFVWRESLKTPSSNSRVVYPKLITENKEKVVRKQCTSRENYTLEMVIKRNPFKMRRKNHLKRTKAGVNALRVTTQRWMDTNVAECNFSRQVKQSLEERKAELSKVLEIFEIIKKRFCISFRNQGVKSGGRVQRHGICIVWSLEVRVSVFWSPQSMQATARSENFIRSSFMEMLIKFPSRTLSPPTMTKVPTSGSMTRILQCLTGQQSHLTWTQKKIDVLFVGKMTTDIRPEKMSLTWMQLLKQPGLTSPHCGAAVHWGSNWVSWVQRND